MVSLALLHNVTTSFNLPAAGAEGSPGGGEATEAPFPLPAVK